ncbi:DUF559 domain-containing protein [Methylobacterium sp. ARG-1]|uniref:endonuclease domain-containing protein n=1 Tax=Methylobacterium sp. ARG-1 TaxID=1692501 RepID=UPI0009E755F1|nr:DUF559 domain-containing protein [Methylobacterium sp. ARG-1]
MSKSIPRARHLRRNQTTAEAKLWRVLRNRALNGWKFRRQYPIDRFIVDFACSRRGSWRKSMAQRIRPGESVSTTRRARIIEACGFALLRILNADIHQDLDGVRETVWAALPSGDPV